MIIRGQQALVAVYSVPVTRVELIDRDGGGRMYVRNPKPGRAFHIELCYQDGGRTLKIFVEPIIAKKKPAKKKAQIT